VALLFEVLLWATKGGIRPSPSTTLRGEPEDTIYTLIERWREGDVEGYLNCFAGPARGRLEATSRPAGMFWE